jgi:hypothetical protein
MKKAPPSDCGAERGLSAFEPWGLESTSGFTYGFIHPEGKGAMERVKKFLNVYRTAPALHVHALQRPDGECHARLAHAQRRARSRNELRNYACDDLALSFGFLPSSLLKGAVIGERVGRQGADKTNQ